MGRFFSRRLISRVLLVVYSAATLLLPAGRVSAQTALGDCLNDIIKKDAVWFNGCGSSACSGTSSTGNVTLVGSDAIQQAYNFFITQGLTPAQAAGVVGNLKWESGLIPTLKEDGGNSQTQPKYNLPGTNHSPGWGIAQWTYPYQDVDQLFKQYNVGGNEYDLGPQLQLVWDQMTDVSPTGVKDMVAGLKAIQGNSADIAAQVADYFNTNFEGGTAGQREQYARDVFNQYGGGGTTGGTTGSTTTSGCSGSVNCTSPATTATAGLSQTRQQVVCVAEGELQLWASGQGDCHKYTTQSPSETCEEWCADFVSWVFNQAGYPFSGGQNGGWRLPAVSGIEQLGRQNGNFHWHDASGYTPRPGDIVIYGSAHTNIVVDVSGGTITTIGGNQADKVTKGGLDSGLTGYVSPD